MQSKQKKVSKNTKQNQINQKPSQEENSNIISKLQTELKEVQNSSKIIVKPEISIISDPDLYFSFMEIAAMNLYAQKRNSEALKILTQLFTQYQEFKNHSDSNYDTSEFFNNDIFTTQKKENN
jgi:hypothetical protein